MPQRPPIQVLRRHGYLEGHLNRYGGDTDAMEATHAGTEATRMPRRPPKQVRRRHGYLEGHLNRYGGDTDAMEATHTGTEATYRGGRYSTN